MKYGRLVMPTQRSAAPAVRVEGVIKRFGATVALAGVDLEVVEGAVLGLLGPSGAGKTTLLPRHSLEIRPFSLPRIAHWEDAKINRLILKDREQLKVKKLGGALP